jgi:tRNA modification GTPase
MAGPDTYTGEDSIEIHCHGSPVVVDRLIGAALQAGARAAEPGEFTRRAVLNGRMDLLQAEAVADLVSSQLLAGVKAANQQLEGALSSRLSWIRTRIVDLLADVEAHIDFADEDIAEEDARRRSTVALDIAQRLEALTSGFEASRRAREGYRVVLAGRPNVGKSSLFNALIGFGRAIVADEPGTTRDSVEEIVDLQGHGFVLIDTAGIREDAGRSESIAIERSRAAASSADIRIAVIDASSPLVTADHELLAKREANGATLCVLNKCDLGEGLTSNDRRLLDELDGPIVRTSALGLIGMDDLRRALIDTASALRGDASVPAGLSRERHRSAAERARAALERARGLLATNERSEVAAVELRDALAELAAITEPLDNEAILDRIFAEFCVGK